MIEATDRKTMRVFRACPGCGAMLEGSITTVNGRYDTVVDRCATCTPPPAAEPNDYELPHIEREEC